MPTLSRLIAKCDWDSVYQKLLSGTEETSIPIATPAKDKVYILHQALCSKVNPVPDKVLLVLIKQFPDALDLNAFIEACENPRLPRASMEILFDLASTETLHAVEYMARVLASKSVRKKNVCVVQLFIERFPAILEGGSVLEYAITNGTAEIVDKILEVGVHEKIGRAGGLYNKVNGSEDSLDVAIKLYDENDDERRHILATCLQYANASKMGLELPDPNYPVILAAVGLVPKRILESFLAAYSHEITRTKQAGKYAILKTIQLSEEDKKDDELPSIFNDSILINACSNGQLEQVKDLLVKMSHKSSEDYARKYFKTLLHTASKKNALEVATDLFDENDNNRCEILKICVQYANAAKMGKDVPPSNYPTILAAVGLVPDQVLLGLGRKYQSEIRDMDRTGKFALKKVLKMKEERVKYANRLDSKCQYPLHIDTRRIKFNRTLATIPGAGEPRRKRFNIRLTPIPQGLRKIVQDVRNSGRQFSQSQGQS